MLTLQSAHDNELIRSFQEGNEQALETLVRRYQDKIFSSIFFMTRDKYLAEDLFQEVFIKIIDTLRSDRYNEEGKFLQWALRVAHNLCIDYFRKHSKLKIVFNDNPDLLELHTSNNDYADKNIMRSQSHERVQKMLDLLPQEQREVIVLRHFANLCFKDIAQITQSSINTCLGRMRYGLINLRRIMVENEMVL